MKEWNDILQEWKSINIETYQFLFENASNYLKQMIEESQSITKKSIFILTTFLGFTSGIVTFFDFKDTVNYTTFLPILILITSNTLIFFLLNKGRNSYFLGEQPKISFTKDFNYDKNEKAKNYNVDEKLKLAYKYELKRYQIKINKIRYENKKRHILLNIQIATFIISMLIIFYLGR